MRLFCCAALSLALLLLGCSGSAPGPGSASSGGEHWVSVWQAPPTDAAIPVDASLHLLVAGPSQTFRLVFSPLGGGSRVRVHLSNRFGSAPVVFDAVRIAHSTSGADIDPATSVPVLFDGNKRVTIAAGQDVVSDPLAFRFSSFDDLAVTIAASDPGTIPTQHHTARQHSYVSPPGSGDHSDDASGAMFVQSITMRPFVVGLDTLAPSSTSAVVTFGDSLTDGYQGSATLLPEDIDSIDRNQRYPDFLRRRFEQAGRPVFVSNAGVSGNRVLEDGLIPSFGPKALTRLDADVLAQSGVTDVILWEGINDIGQTPDLTVEQLTDAYAEIIARLQAAGLRVIQGTLTPAGNFPLPSYSSPSATALRRSVNDWIRSQSPADAIVDFDAAVRDLSNPDVIAAQYDGGDGLHFNVAGYERLATAVDLEQILGSSWRTTPQVDSPPSCRPSRHAPP